jgi:hypothetical protein
MLWLVAVQFIVLHTVEGHEVYIEPSHVTSLMVKRDDPRRVMHERVNCLVVMSNGRFLSVAEDCASVRKRLEEAR